MVTHSISDCIGDCVRKCSHQCRPPPHSPCNPCLLVVPSPRVPQVSPSQYLGPRGVHREMTNKDGLRLQSYWWPAEQPKAAVLFCHGHGAHLMFEVLKQTVGGGGAGDRLAAQQEGGKLAGTAGQRLRGVATPRGAPRGAAPRLLAHCPSSLLSPSLCDSPWERRCAPPAGAVKRCIPQLSLLLHACFFLPPLQQNLGEPMCYAGSWAEQWNAAGISVCGVDLQVGWAGLCGLAGVPALLFSTWSPVSTWHLQSLLGRPPTPNPLHPAPPSRPTPPHPTPPHPMHPRASTQPRLVSRRAAGAARASAACASLWSRLTITWQMCCSWHGGWPAICCRSSPAGAASSTLPGLPRSFPAVQHNCLPGTPTTRLLAPAPRSPHRFTVH